jgi:transcriptional regulator with XRE-family HTH domain
MKETNPQLKKIIGQRLRALRIQSDKKMAAVASETGFAISVISKVENGKYNLTIDMMEQLAGYYNTSPYQMLRM